MSRVEILGPGVCSTREIRVARTPPPLPSTKHSAEQALETAKPCADASHDWFIQLCVPPRLGNRKVHGWELCLLGCPGRSTWKPLLEKVEERAPREETASSFLKQRLQISQGESLHRAMHLHRCLPPHPQSFSGNNHHIAFGVTSEEEIIYE